MLADLKIEISSLAKINKAFVGKLGILAGGNNIQDVKIIVKPILGKFYDIIKIPKTVAGLKTDGYVGEWIFDILSWLAAGPIGDMPMSDKVGVAKIPSLNELGVPNLGAGKGAPKIGLGSKGGLKTGVSRKNSNFGSNRSIKNFSRSSTKKKGVALELITEDSNLQTSLAGSYKQLTSSEKKLQTLSEPDEKKLSNQSERTFLQVSTPNSEKIEKIEKFTSRQILPLSSEENYIIRKLQHQIDTRVALGAQNRLIEDIDMGLIVEYLTVALPAGLDLAWDRLEVLAGHLGLMSFGEESPIDRKAPDPVVQICY